MVQVWRVGSVLDSKAGMMPHKCAMLNVVIEPWSLKMMQMEYNPYFGESLALTPIDGRAVLDLLRLCEQFVQQEGASIVQALESLGPLYRTTFADEVAHWEAADAEWRDNVSLAGLRGRTPADYPPPEVGSSATRGGHHGPQLGGRSYYADGSDELKAFYALFRNGIAWCARCRLLFTGGNRAPCLGRPRRRAQLADQADGMGGGAGPDRRDSGGTKAPRHRHGAAPNHAGWRADCSGSGAGGQPRREVAGTVNRDREHTCVRACVARRVESLQKMDTS